MKITDVVCRHINLVAVDGLPTHMRGQTDTGQVWYVFQPNGWDCVETDEIAKELEEAYQQYTLESIPK